MADNFQPDFYVTCATVIPVLFLAYAVQGGAYASFLKLYEQIEKYNSAWVPPPRPRRPGAYLASTTRVLLTLTAAPILLLGAILTVVAGGLGEGLAIYALYQGTDQAGIRLVVFVATLVLVAVVIVVPLQAALRSVKSAQDVFSQLTKARAATAAEAQSGEPPNADEGPAPDRTTVDDGS
jgi:hypothetical protein